MQITNEEMEALNRATEILSKFVENGSIQRESFDLFENMVVSAIDSTSNNTCEVKRKDIEVSPFSHIMIMNVLGCYGNDGIAKFIYDVNALNVTFSDNYLQFQVLTETLREEIANICDFTISPVLLYTSENSLFGLTGIDHNPAVADIDSYSNIQESDSVLKAKTVNAPFDAEAPIVFECKMNSCEDNYPYKFTARVLRIHVAEKAMTNHGVFDIVKAWRQMSWKKIGQTSKCSDSDSEKNFGTPIRSTGDEERKYHSKQIIALDTIQKLVEGINDPVLFRNYLQASYSGCIVSEECIKAINDEYCDAELLRYVLEYHFSGQTVSEKFVQGVIDDFGDVELLKYVLEDHFSGQTVSEEFVQGVIDDFGDVELLKYVLENHFSGQTVSERFLRGVLDDFGDADLLKYVLKNHYSGIKVSQKFIQEVSQSLDDTSLMKYILKNHY